MDLDLAFNEENYLLTIPDQEIRIDNDELKIGGAV